MSSGGALQPLHAAEPLLTQRLPPALAEPERKWRESARLASHLAAVRPPRCPAALSQPADQQPGAIQQRHAHSQASVMWIGAEHARLHQGCVKGLARSIASKQHAFLGSPPVSPPATTRACCLGTGRQPRGRYRPQLRQTQLLAAPVACSGTAPQPAAARASLQASRPEHHQLPTLKSPSAQILLESPAEGLGVL